ncbi:MAG: hypothetical protein ACRDPK_11145 [Carbonactinosporaceae bacterium]
MVMVVAHLTIAAIWLGSMVYSLAVVQPTVARVFTDESRQEEFLLALAHGNRRRVVALVAFLVVSDVWVMVTWPRAVGGYGVALALYAAAAAIFLNVSWRHWPARVFALPEELARYRLRLRIQALVMLAAVGAAFVAALGASIGLWS